jgi:hypothetical protein
LTPLAFNLGYALANGISRFSSWRYNLPVDWIVYFYFGIGVIEIMMWVASLFGANVSKMFSIQTNETIQISLRQKQVFLVAAFVLLGALPWLAEGIAQPRYISTTEELKELVVARNSEVSEFLSQPNSQILQGRLLYPRFFRRNDGIFSAHPWPIYEARDFSRLGFIVLNEGALSVIFSSKSPVKLTHGADVIVLGCQRDNYIEARWMYFPETDEEYQIETPADSCLP